jgi:hypothetical protein
LTCLTREDASNSAMVLMLQTEVSMVE